MSLLMDALRKAEEEKRRAALERKGEATPAAEGDHLASTYPPEGASEQQKSQTGEHSSANLRLEPMEGAASDLGNQTHTQTVTMTGGGATGPGSATLSDTSTGTFGDTTRMRLNSAQKDVFDALGVPRRSESTGTFDSLRDPDSTVPSKRMLKKSLEEYFESTRSIEGSKIEVALAEQAATRSDRTRESTIPPISDSGPITAQTVFASKRRSSSNTLFSAAASLLLLAAAGLAAVGGYHWYTQSRLAHVAPSPSMAQSAEGVETVAPDASYTMPPVPPINPPVASATSTTEDHAQKQSSSTATLTTTAAAVPPTPAPLPAPESPATSPTQVATAAEPNPPATTPAPATPSPAPTPPVTMSPAAEMPAPATTTTAETPKTPESTVAAVEPPTAAAIENLQAQAPRVPKSSLPKPKVSSALDGSVMPGEIRISRTKAIQPFVPGQVQEAYDAYQHRDYNRAETLYRIALNRYPGNRDALRGIAALEWRRGDLDTAAATYNRLLQMDPEDATARAGLLALQKDKNPVNDESSIKLLLQREPESVTLRSALGDIYARQQRWPEAQQSYFDAFARDKLNPDLAYNLAVSLDHIGEHKSALDYYRKAVELSGKSPARFAAADVQSRIQALAASSGSAP
jgi:Tfp pilus assembly protein PilF